MKYGDTFRFNGKCECGCKFSVHVTVAKAPAPAFIAYRANDGREFSPAPDGSHRIVWTCSCGRKRYARPVIGKFNPRKACTAKCMASTGHDCECSCGGRNHGAAHAH